MQDSVSSPNPDGWLENLIEEWLTVVNRGVLGPLHQSKAAHASRHRDDLLLPANSCLCEFSSGCSLGALCLNALHGREFIRSNSCTVDGAGWTARSCGFTFRRLRAMSDLPPGKAACDKVFVSIASVSVGAAVLDRSACDLIKSLATVNVFPHLDPKARVIVESPNGPVVQTNEGSRRFPMKLVSTTVLLICSLCGVSWNAQRSDWGTTSMVVELFLRSGGNTFDNVRFGMAQNSPNHHCHRPDRPVRLGQKRSGMSNFDRGFSCLWSKHVATCYFDHLALPKHTAPFLWTTSNHRG